MNPELNDPALSLVVDRWLTGDDRTRTLDLLMRLTADTERLSDLASVADRNPPQLRQFDREGTRIDEIDYHPAYQQLCDAAYREYALSALSHRPAHGWETKPPHLVKYLASYVFVQSEFGLACPVSMTDAAARTLRMFGDPAVFQPWIDGLTATDPETAMTGAMFMTEPQAGTDIAQTATIATRDGDMWRLSGKKWFASNPDADVIITLARYPGGPQDSTQGVGMFMVPRRIPDGTHNSYTIDRLKDKLGTRSMPSGEVTLDGAHALQVGELDRGFRQMAEMVNTSRLSNAMRSAALMRRAVRDAVTHTYDRIVFGKRLFDQPLMRATLLPLALDAEAALALVGYSADCLQRADAGDLDAKALVRVLTPIAKHYVCKRARHVTGEAMEIRGGNGYIEEWGFAKLVRDSHLGSIWEGSSNVIALDVLRCMRKDAAHRRLGTVMCVRLAELNPECEPGVAALTERWTDLIARGDALVAGSEDAAQIGCGRYADELATATMASLLFDLASHQLAAGRGHRSLLVANAYLTSSTGGPSAAGITHLAAIIDGADVNPDAARAAAPRVLEGADL